MPDLEFIKTAPIERIKQELDSYVPPPLEIKKALTLIKVLEECAIRGYHVAVYGGYGLDGLYGKLTRSHGDGDLICKTGEERPVCQTLLDLGFKQEPTKNGEKWVVNSPVFGEFDIEVGSSVYFTQLTNLPESEFLSERENADLLGHKFRTVTQKGQKGIIISPLKIAIPEGFGPYPQKKIENREMIFRVLEEREKSLI